MAHTVTAPLVVAKLDDGSYVYVYQGGQLPDDVDEEHLAQLLDQKMVEEGPADGDRPAANAGVKAWRAYAVAQGMSEEDAAALSRDELRDQYAD